MRSYWHAPRKRTLPALAAEAASKKSNFRGKVVDRRVIPGVYIVDISVRCEPSFGVGVENMFDVRGNGWITVGALGLALAFSTSAFAAKAPDDERKGSDKIQTLIIRGDAIRCKVQKYNDRYIWIIPVFGDVEIAAMRLPWSALSATTIRQVRGKDERASAVDRLLARGGTDMVEALSVRMKNGTIFVALELKERSTADVLVVKRRSIPEAEYPREDIKSIKHVRAPMTEFYSKDEIFQTKLSEMNPETARDHIALAEEMMKIHHWVKVIDLCKRACILDESFTESTREMIAEASAAKVADNVRALDLKMKSDYRARRWWKLLNRIDQMSEFDPDNPLRTKWDARREEIVTKLQKDMRRQIVSSYYRKMSDLVAKRASGRVSDGEIPGVIVTTKRGEVLRGTLVSKDDEFVIIESSGKTLEIATSLVTRVQNVDLSRKTRRATFSEAKDYATDGSGGITADILKALEKQYGKFGTADNPVTQESIKEIWDNRLTTVATYTESGIVKTDRVYSFHEAEYKTGTWLREGGGGGGDSGAEADPDKWWQKQPADLRSNILRAIAAEALCDVLKVVNKSCPTCGGAGILKSVQGLASGSIGMGARACPTCRGLRRFIKIRYR
jgi:hypothetical protein